MTLLIMTILMTLNTCDITYNDITYNDITYNDITFNDIIYNWFDFQMTLHITVNKKAYVMSNLLSKVYLNVLSSFLTFIQ
jgi:hypothetical protein